ITFQIGSGPHTILVGDSGLGALPFINQAVTIDGTTQPGFKGKPIIELSGTQAGANASGLQIFAPDPTVRGIVVDGVVGRGVVLSNPQVGGPQVLAGNYIGTDLSGTQARGNGVAGVEVSGIGVTIGGTAARDRNVISGNVGGRGVLLGQGGSV